ncbi:hypothetical protein BKA81DRAFT_99414 [Phyllosticta paracitricarpa]
MAVARSRFTGRHCGEVSHGRSGRGYDASRRQQEKRWTHAWIPVYVPGRQAQAVRPRMRNQTYHGTQMISFHLRWSIQTKNNKNTTIRAGRSGLDEQVAGEDGSRRRRAIWLMASFQAVLERVVCWFQLRVGIDMDAAGSEHASRLARGLNSELIRFSSTFLD